MPSALCTMHYSLYTMCVPSSSLEEDCVHGGKERMLIHSLVSSHEVVLGLGSDQAEVGRQAELLHGRGLVGDDVDHELTPIKSPQLSPVLLTATVHGRAVHEGRKSVELLPGDGVNILQKLRRKNGLLSAQNALFSSTFLAKRSP